MRGLLEARDGRLYATPPPLFPWVASLFFPVFGERTVDFAPILFVFLSALVLGLILDRVMQRDFLYWLLLAAFLARLPRLDAGLSVFGDGPRPVPDRLGPLAPGEPLRGSSLCSETFRRFIPDGGLGARPDGMHAHRPFFLCFCDAMVFVFQKRMKELWTVLAGVGSALAVFVLHDVLLHGHFPGPYLQAVPAVLCALADPRCRPRRLAGALLRSDHPVPAGRDRTRSGRRSCRSCPSSWCSVPSC